LIYLIEEGAVVAKGEKLAELDVSSIEDKQANQAITVAKAIAALDQAQKNFEIMENSLEAAKSAAESRLIIGKMREEKFIGQAVTAAQPANGGSVAGTNREMVTKLRDLLESEFLDNANAEVNYSGLVNKVTELMGEENIDLEMGEMANLVLRQIDNISLARADQKLAEDTLDHSQRLFLMDFITKNEMEKDDIDHKRQLSKVTLAWNDLELLIKYTLLETKITLDQDVRNAALDLESVIATNEATRVRERVELVSKEAEQVLATERLDNWNRQIQNSIIYAPTPGWVVYAKEGGGRGRQPVEEGVEIRERQALINLPDVTNMIAELKVHEAQVDQVAVGQRAVVKVDAFPERTFVGKVSHVSALPDSGSRFTNNDLKVYKATVAIDGENPDGALRPGMNATVEILVGVVPDIISVPVPGVFHEGVVAYAWKITPDGPTAVIIEIGNNNLSHVEIVEGLQEGDMIYLGTPPGSEAPEFEQPEDGFEVEDAISLEPGSAVQAGMRSAPDTGGRPMGGGREFGRGGRGGRGGGRGGQGGGNNEFLNQLREHMIAEIPDRAAEFEDMGNWFRMLRDPGFQNEIEGAIQSRPDLLEQWQAYRERASSRGRDRGERGQGPGRERGGRRGRGGQEPGRESDRP
jgi:multidrug efflux pump subunit AcrA (membrane-fusion protein)